MIQTLNAHPSHEAPSSRRASSYQKLPEVITNRCEMWVTANETTFQGGAALNLNTTAIVADSTLTGNSATGNTGEAAHPLGGGAILNYGALTLINDTIAGNAVGGTFRGSNIYNFHNDVSTGTITYRNTIVANGSGDANCFYEPSSVATDGGNNLDSGASCGFSSANHSLTNTDPKLAALADNGGPTQTMALEKPQRLRRRTRQRDRSAWNRAPTRARMRYWRVRTGSHRDDHHDHHVQRR
jgi:hypothetical protein